MRQVRIHSILLGLLILALGIVWLLRNLGVVEADIGGLIATYWPALLIIWGLDAIFSAVSPPSNGGSRSQGVFSASGIFGLVLVILGVVIIGRNLGLYHVDLSIIWRVLWPIVIILIGWSLIRGSSAAGGTYWAVMSGIERKVPGWNLELLRRLLRREAASWQGFCARIAATLPRDEKHGSASPRNPRNSWCATRGSNPRPAD